MRELVYSTLFHLIVIGVIAAVPKDTTVKDSEDASGCSYRGNFYNSGMKIKSQDPCVYCVCEGSTLQCTLELCSTYSTIPRGCKLVSKPGKCCQELVCDKTFSKASPPKTQAKQGCTVGQNHYKDGDAIPSSDPCQQCYCLQNQTQCITQECLLPPDVVLNCQPAIEKDKCCPVRYHCQNGNEQQTIEVQTTKAAMTTTSKTQSVTSTPKTADDAPGGRKLDDDKNNQKTHGKGFFNETGCQEEGHWYKIGERVPHGNDPCMTCMCDKDGVTCSVVQCRELPLGVSSCKQARDNQCCQTANNCTCTYNTNEPYARAYEQTTCEFCGYNGTVYPLGARIHTAERCQVCLCRDTGIYCLGRAECDDAPEQLSKYKSCKPIYNDDLDACCPFAYDCIDFHNKVKRILQSGQESTAANTDHAEVNITSSARDQLADDTEIPLITPMKTNENSTSGCNVEGKKFKLGDIIDMDDPCLHCKCNSESAVTCSRSTCRKLPFGVKECALRSKQCCPDWQNCTCSYQQAQYHVLPLKDMKCSKCISNDQLYQPGQQLQIDDTCYKCMCTESGISCQKSVQCTNELSPEDVEARGCVPIFGDDKCCPTDYKCVTDLRSQGRILHAPTNAGNTVHRRPRPRPNGCLHNGKLYEYNQELPKTDPCSTCNCDVNGTIACVSMQCQRQPIGVTGCKRILNSNICCPVLVDCSCYHLADAPEGRVYTDVTCGTCLTRNRRYRPGDIIPSHDPCRQCECTERGVVCDTVMECDPPPSQDCTPIFDSKQCCPVEYECRRFVNRGQSSASIKVQRPPGPYPISTARPNIVFPSPSNGPQMTFNSRITNNNNGDSNTNPVTGKKSEHSQPDYDYYYEDGTSDDYANTKVPISAPSIPSHSNFNYPTPNYKNECRIGSSIFQHGDEIQTINSCNRCRCYNSNIKCTTLGNCKM